MSEFDPSEYMRAPVISVSGGITLARALVDAKPRDMPPSVNKAADKLAAAADAAQEIISLRQRAAGEESESTREVDSDADSSWSALRMRLEAYALLPTSSFPRAQRAEELVGVLFGDGGLAFLRERYPVQFTLADTILKRIDQDGLQADIDALAGPEFLQNIRAQHKRYDGMVKSVLMRERAEEEDLRDHLRSLQRAISSYAIKLCATVDEDDPTTAEQARAALQPIVNFRQSNARHRASSDSSEAAVSPESPESTEPAGSA